MAGMVGILPDIKAQAVDICASGERASALFSIHDYVLSSVQIWLERHVLQNLELRRLGSAGEALARFLSRLERATFLSILVNTSFPRPAAVLCGKYLRR
jgi:hypothetical protein